MDDFVKVLEDEVQIVALSIFALMYVARLLWLRSLRQPLEKMEPKGSARKGILLSFGSVLMPWTMVFPVARLIAGPTVPALTGKDGRVWVTVKRRRPQETIKRGIRRGFLRSDEKGVGASPKAH